MRRRRVVVKRKKRRRREEEGKLTRTQRKRGMKRRIIFVRR